ncbi:type I secretion system membrane fusion protein PrsE [bacterium BMS3Bbin10]|nr:type I secretion system membrane fusion protein PrsE [bacterium BMS3Bbin10]
MSPDLKTSQWATSPPEREDLNFVRDVEAALRDRPPRASTIFLITCAALFTAFLGWSFFAEIDEVTRGEGQVVPSTRKQVVQSLEGGIVKEILAREGDVVKKDQVLLRIDDTGFSSDLGELVAKQRSLSVQVKRLRTEADNPDTKDIDFGKKLPELVPSVVENELTLFSIRKSSLENQISLLNERLTQRKQELAELRENRKRFKNGLDIAQREFDIKQPLALRGIVSKTDVLKLEREISDLKGQLATTEQSVPRVEASIREAERLVDEQKLAFRQGAQTELNAKLSELTVVDQSIKAASDRVERTDIRSPVDGIVNKLHVNTIGGVVRAGEPLVEITPVEDVLQVEVQIQPKDIAFITPNQKALIKITAYDFTIYGALDGQVENISPDSSRDPNTNESYYLATIKTNETILKKGGRSFPIIPGMVAQVDIVTGKKTVLNYILKPIIKARREALRER